MAQITLMNRAQRGPGQFDTASSVVGTDVFAASVVFDLHPNEMGTTKAVKFDVFVSDDDGQTWRHDMGATSKGPWAGLPFLSTDPTRYHTKRVMARIDLPQQIRCGIVLYVNEEPPQGDI